MSNIVLKFPVYEMETENFTVYITETGKISGLRNGNWKFYGFHLIWNYPGIPVYATNFRIIPFPKWKFFPEKWKPYLYIPLSFFLYSPFKNPRLRKIFQLLFINVYQQHKQRTHRQRTQIYIQHLWLGLILIQIAGLVQYHFYKHNRQ